MSLVSIMATVVMERNQNMHSIGQGLLNMFRDLGKFSGTVIGSFVLGEKSLGPIVLYRGMSVVVVCSGVFLFFVFKKYSSRKEEQGQILLSTMEHQSKQIELELEEEEEETTTTKDSSSTRLLL